MMSQVFISYSHADPDRDLAVRLQDYIEANGFQVWADSKIGLGQDWVEQIDVQLRRSTHLVALLSPVSIKSDMVRREIAIAYSLKKADKLTILPVFLALDDELPYELGAYLDRIQHIAWRPGESIDSICHAILGALQGRVTSSPEKRVQAPAQRADPKQFAGAEFEAITAQIARHLGPVARMVVNEAARKAQNWAELYSLLAPEIPAGDERKRFEARVHLVR